MADIDKHKLYQDFQETFPLEKLGEMTIEQYTNLNRSDSFCYWLESKTSLLGSIWGGSAYKFGIFHRDSEPGDNSKFLHDENYSWYASLASDRDTAFKRIKAAIIKIANAARNGEYELIDSVSEFGDVCKWKIAFLYSEEKLIPYYKRKYLLAITKVMGHEFEKNAPISAIQRYLISQKGDKDIFDYYSELQQIHVVNSSDQSDANTNNETASYSKDDFLSEVFMSENDFTHLERLLLRKKNIILQGAPGVGKTYTAKRLAYAMMGEKDESRIESVQFHQNYSYEDFIMGYKPNEDSFSLHYGIFYEFCRRASNDPSRDYFFIIDEINRGNLSKIFGELLQLIEADYREKAIRLAYSKDELFAVPKNLYIIGMMNTADRSLAMIDYALRRRFSFFDMTPGFDSSGFSKYREAILSPYFDRLIDAVKAVNEDILKDDSLGKGFLIGHSYLIQPVYGDDRDENLFDFDMTESIIEYDLIPLVSEYWFDNETRFNAAVDKLRNVLK